VPALWFIVSDGLMEAEAAGASTAQTPVTSRPLRALRHIIRIVFPFSGGAWTMGKPSVTHGLALTSQPRPNPA
jgi:hypothetical protein